MVNYGGDEISALVVDIGASSLRAGYAGDDTPKAIIPTTYGFSDEQAPTPADGADVAMGEDGAQAPPPAGPKVKMYLGQHGPSLWRPNMEVRSPFRESLIDDFTPIPALVSHALRDVLGVDPAEHPVLVTEPAWNTPKNRERMAEIMFEELNVPAFYIANTGVLNAFAAGKGTALVIDIGQSTASVTPVVDGFVLRKGMQYNSLPTLIHSHAHHTLQSGTRTRPGVQIIPQQLIASKIPTEMGQPPQYALRDDRVKHTTLSWKAWAEAREVDDWTQSIGGCLDVAWNEHQAMSRPARAYEFASGQNVYFGAERFQVGELFFHHRPELQAANAHMPQPLPQLIGGALGACDPDLRQLLLANVVLTGGGSQFAGLAERLSNEMNRAAPGVKIHAPGNPTERRYGAWLGGSILASLGTFHQLWISREEWKEHGSLIVGQRCK